MKYSISFFLAFLILSSCTGNKADQEKFKSAYELQKSAIQLIAEIEEELETRQSLKADSIENVLEELEESIFAIPGYELELPGHEGHDHDHGPKVELTADEILAVHQTLLQQLQEIESLLSNND